MVHLARYFVTIPFLFGKFCNCSILKGIFGIYFRRKISLVGRHVCFELNCVERNANEVSPDQDDDEYSFLGFDKKNSTEIFFWLSFGYSSHQFSFVFLLNVHSPLLSLKMPPL